MKRVAQWVLMILGGIFGLILLAAIVAFAWLNYQHPKTQEQQDSLQKIHDLGNNPQPNTFSEDLPNVEPEIYDDRNLDKATPEEHLKP